MSPSLQKKLKNIESYILLLEKHNEKLLGAISLDDTSLIMYYRKETEGFIGETEKIFRTLNRHSKVEELHKKFLEICKVLDTNFKKYE